MKCPNCEQYIEIEDWQEEESFSCDESLCLITDESTYLGANDTSLIILDREE